MQALQQSLEVHSQETEGAYQYYNTVTAKFQTHCARGSGSGAYLLVEGIVPSEELLLLNLLCIVNVLWLSLCDYPSKLPHHWTKRVHIFLDSRVEQASISF